MVRFCSHGLNDCDNASRPVNRRLRLPYMIKRIFAYANTAIRKGWREKMVGCFRRIILGLFYFNLIFHHPFADDSGRHLNNQKGSHLLGDGSDLARRAGANRPLLCRIKIERAAGETAWEGE
jgi:hypothetical protein